MNALEAIHRRRSVRSFTGAPIPRADLEQIVDAARLAPSGRNQQLWEFVVVTDRQTMTQMRMVAEWIDTAGAIIAVVLDPSSRWWIEDGVGRGGEHVDRCHRAGLWLLLGGGLHASP